MKKREGVSDAYGSLLKSQLPAVPCVLACCAAEAERSGPGAQGV